MADQQKNTSKSDFLYPREGTETVSEKWFAVLVGDFLYPREGTEITG